MDSIEQIDIAPETLSRWTEAAERLADHTTAPRAEILDLRHDPTRHRLGRAAKACRYAETIRMKPGRGGLVLVQVLLALR